MKPRGGVWSDWFIGEPLGNSQHTEVEVRTFIDPSEVAGELEAARAERDHWKANHDEQVAKKQRLRRDLCEGLAQKLDARADEYDAGAEKSGHNSYGCRQKAIATREAAALLRDCVGEDG